MKVLTCLIFTTLACLSISLQPVFAQEAVTFCISGGVSQISSKPDLLGLGTDAHEFTVSITIGPADTSDVNYAIGTAEYRSADFQITIDGVPLTSGSHGGIAFFDRPSPSTDYVILFLTYMDSFGDLHFLGFAMNVPTDTFTLTQNYEPFVPFPTTSIVGLANDSSANAQWYVDGGDSIVVSSLGCDPPTVIELIENLVLVTEQINLDNGLSNSLDSKLDNIFDAWMAENIELRGDVLNKLGAFGNAVEAQRGKKISELDADLLVAAAEDIAALILTGSE